MAIRLMQVLALARLLCAERVVEFVPIFGHEFWGRLVRRQDRLSMVRYINYSMREMFVATRQATNKRPSSKLPVVAKSSAGASDEADDGVSSVHLWSFARGLRKACNHRLTRQKPKENAFRVGLTRKFRNTTFHHSFREI